MPRPLARSAGGACSVECASEHEIYLSHDHRRLRTCNDDGSAGFDPMRSDPKRCEPRTGTPLACKSLRRQTGRQTDRQAGGQSVKRSKSAGLSRPQLVCYLRDRSDPIGSDLFCSVRIGSAASFARKSRLTRSSCLGCSAARATRRRWAGAGAQVRAPVHSAVRSGEPRAIICLLCAPSTASAARRRRLQLTRLQLND